MTGIRTLTPNDLEAASRLMDRAWSTDYGSNGYIRYEMDILTRQFENEKPSVWLGAFSGDELVGVNVSFPRELMVYGRKIRAAIPTYLSVDPDARRRGIASALVKEIVKRNEAEGIELMLPYFDDEGKGKAVYSACFPGIFPIRSAGWLGRLLDPDTFSKGVGYDVPAAGFVKGKLKTDWLGADRGGLPSMIGRAVKNFSPLPEECGGWTETEKEDIDRILEMTEPRFPCERIWKRDELGRELEDPESITAGYCTGGKIQSIMHFKLRTIVARDSVKFAWFDWLYGRRGIQRTLANALVMAKKRGAAFALVPKMGYFSSLPFIRTGFIPYPKHFELWGIGIGGYRPPVLKKIRLDVR